MMVIQKGYPRETNMKVKKQHYENKFTKTFRPTIILHIFTKV